MIDKELNDFTKGRNQCKECIKDGKRKNYYNKIENELLRAKIYRENNKEKIKKNDAILYENNKEKIKERVKKYANENKDKIKEQRKKYYNKNKNIIAAKTKKYYNINKEKRKEYQENNKEIKNAYQRKYFRNRAKTDPLFKLSNNIRSLIAQLLKNNGYKKHTKTLDILGCSFIEFKIYLETKFENWMSWENYGKYNGELNYGWDIDHIIPVSNGKTEEEVVNLNHYLNLQPLCSHVNRNIKRNY